jgi:hypothetical protein
LFSNFARTADFTTVTLSANRALQTQQPIWIAQRRKDAKEIQVMAALCVWAPLREKTDFKLPRIILAQNVPVAMETVVVTKLSL